jgi:formate dehydrogenase iron-sulfur subunit
MKITRREFLQYSAAGALALSAVPLLDRAALARSLEGGKAEQVGILVDTTRCIGCRACQVACKQKNNLPADPQPYPTHKTFPSKLSETTFSLLEWRVVGEDTMGKPVFHPVKKQCMHCLEPACASVCPVAAITKTEQGPVVYDPEKCMGCRYCMAACPFGIPKYEWGSGNPRIRKCEMCADLIAAGKQPACVAACPVGALSFGTRAELVAEAQKRVADPAGKYQPYIYGLNEVGGTSVLYLSDVPFDQLGFNTDLPQTPLPTYTGQVMEKVPAVAVGVGLLMGGIAWWNHRTNG